MGKISLLFNEYLCSGCHTCEIACKQEHGLGVGPRVIRVLEESPYFKPLFCHHCDDPPCVKACPEDAITKDSETGVVLLDLEKCTGCNAAPGTSGAEKQGTSPCKAECPAHIDVQGYVSLAAKGKFQEALELIKEASPFPSICGRICPHPCESACNRGGIDDPVANHAIERFVADLDLNTTKRYMPKIKEKKKDEVAIIGSGPAGLTCAYYLAQEGYQVTIFEKDTEPGGMLTAGIPSYRLPREVVNAEIQLIRDMDVTIKTGVEIGKDTTIAQLREEGFKAFFTAIGTQACLELGIEGENLDGVYGGLDYLRKINRGESVTLGKDIAVIGGGNTAMDAARSARRTGAENAFILYRRSLEEMPANAEEIKECQEEGIPIKTLAQPLRFIGENGRVKAIECVKMKLTEPDESGRPKPEPVPDSVFTMEVDAVINALGQEADWACLTPECACTLSDWGTMNVDPLTLQSDDPDIFAGGDAARGSRTVIEAIADGKQAAISIDRFILGRDLRLGRDQVFPTITDPQKEVYNKIDRVQMPCLDPQARIKSFDEVQKGLTEEMVLEEAKRCISCGTCCVQACPYDVMQFNHDTLKAVKCDLCVDKRGNNEAPACFSVCPVRCIFWGDPEEYKEAVRIL
ncbi:MAG: FAD-dependent oxidoreductase [Desulfobacteraceae bacterium]|nr:MAG: FAD-dependent oxidoreductase [Desulfobacteraceae bacterium]